MVCRWLPPFAYQAAPRAWNVRLLARPLGKTSGNVNRVNPEKWSGSPARPGAYSWSSASVVRFPLEIVARPSLGEAEIASNQAEL